MKQQSRWFNILPSIVSVVIGLLCGLILMLLTNPLDAFAGFRLMLQGGFSNGNEGIGQVVFTAIPIILTGLSVGIAFKTGFFNIGASGQFTVGALASILIGVNLTMLPTWLHCPIAVLGGVCAGAAWGAISGYLKARFRVSEVISGIMLNYIAMLLANLLIKSFAYDSAYNQSARVADSAMLNRGMLEWLLPGSGINIGCFITVLAVLTIWFVMKKTTLGYELKTIGKNPYAGLYSGMSAMRGIILSMTIAGALAGLGGALMYLSDFSARISVVDVIQQQGFTGISVALLGMSNPIGVLISGFFMAHLTVGGSYLQLYGFTPEIVGMITGIIIYCSALTLLIKKIVLIRQEKKAQKASNGKGGGKAVE